MALQVEVLIIIKVVIQKKIDEIRYGMVFYVDENVHEDRINVCFRDCNVHLFIYMLEG